MKRTLLITLVLIAGCSLLTQASPEQRWASAATLYTHTLEALVDLKVAGVLDDDDKARIEPYRAAARAAIDKMEASIASDGDGFSEAWDAFSEAIDVMLREQAKAGGAE